MITGASIGFLVAALLTLVVFFQRPVGINVLNTFGVMVFFTGTGAAIGYLVGGVPSCF